MDDIKGKKSGVLMPIFSLPSKYGIGSLGKRAFTFADFLKKTGQTYWQILPIVPTGYCDSPYQTVCGDAGNPYFIDLEILRDKKLLTYREVESAIDKCDFIDYGKLYKERYPLLKKAFSRFDTSSKEFKRFLKISMGSCSELEVHLSFSKDLNYIDEELYKDLSNENDEIGRMINVTLQKWV